jgi:hypothetical protein
VSSSKNFMRLACSSVCYHEVSVILEFVHYIFSSFGVGINCNFVNVRCGIGR